MCVLMLCAGVISLLAESTPQRRPRTLSPVRQVHDVLAHRVGLETLEGFREALNEQLRQVRVQKSQRFGAQIRI